MNKTKIDWATASWNPVTGCLHGCEYCYARGIANRFHDRSANANYIRDRNGNYEELLVSSDGYSFPGGFKPTLYPHRLELPRRTKKPQNIFVCSMADLFGEWVPDEWIKAVFDACAAAPWHNYIFLTKNPARYNEYFSFSRNRPGNFYFGTSACTYNDMVSIRQTLANSLNFLSIEPIHGNMDMGKFLYENPGHLDWVIVGAETGNRKEKVKPKREWVEEIAHSCRAAGVPLFMKSSLAAIWGEPLIQEYPDGLKCST